MLSVVRLRPLVRACRFSNLNRHFSSDSSKTPEVPGTKDGELSISGLARALGKFRELEKGEGAISPAPEKEETFLHLLRNSEFVRMGDPRGKTVIGRIFQVVNTDLYIDFGGKFYCVCRKPKKNSELYVRHAEVKLRINEMELCARFLGAAEDLTLTEASGSILNLISTPVNTTGKNKSHFSVPVNN